MKQLTKVFSVLLIASMWACGGNSGQQQHASEGVMDGDDVKLKQYYVAGNMIYTSYCSNCHQSDGTGLGRVFPPVAKSDFLADNKALIACGIKNGLQKPMTINGQEFNQLMPATAQLSALEIAEVMTFVYNSWGNQHGIIEVTEVQKWLANCQ